MRKHKGRIGVLFLFFFLGLCGLKGLSQDFPFLAKAELLRVVRNEVSGERAWDMVSKISRFHRIRGGGEGSDYNRCVEWLAAELERIGAPEVKIEEFRSDGFKKYYLWNSPVGWKVKEAELWLIKPFKKLYCRFSDQAVSLMPYSQGGEVEAEVVFVEGGKSDKDYAGKDVKGKLVFATGGGGSLVHRHAVLQRGAAGVLVGPSPRTDRLEYADLIEVNRISPTGEEREKTGFGFALSRRQERELLSLYQSGRSVIMRAEVDAQLFDGTMPVLSAVIPGKKYPGQEIVIMGHLDHYKPGANDNASGSAGMFEMVRCITALIERGDIPPLKRTLRFLWLPEMHGATAYLSAHEDLAERGIAGLNLDMIGEDYGECQAAFNLTQAPYSVPGYINDVFANLLPWVDNRQFFSPRGKKYLFNYRIRPYSGGSDHVMFNDSAFAIPTPMLGHGDVFHHTNYDTPDKCDPTEMKRITSLALAVSLYLANAGDKEAIEIAREVLAQARRRMMARTRKSVRILGQEASTQKLGELFFNLNVYPKLQAEIETLNVLEVKELCEQEPSTKVIDQIAAEIKKQADFEKKQIEMAFNLICRDRGIQEVSFRPGRKYTEAMQLKPARLFKGPLPGNVLREKLSAEKNAWYEKNSALAGGSLGSKTFEIVNLMDGKRSLLDIRHIISCEFDETDIEFVLHYVQDLVEAGLVEY